jgi:hypothetical protein
MIRVSVEVSGGTDCFRTAVWAESIERALSLVGLHYPGFDARVLFPIEPDDFFARGSVAEMVLPEVPAEAGLEEVPVRVH